MSSPLQSQRRLLYVGTDLDVLKSVQDGLTDEGWFVVRCPTGSLACILLDSLINYDVLLFDEELPDASGIELVRLARSLEQRRRTPVILLSFKDCAIEARRAGADRVLRKPEHLHALVETVRQSFRYKSSKFKVQSSKSHYYLEP